MLYYLLFMDFTLQFYINFGTNLLIRGPTRIVVFLPISVFRRKGISDGVQTGCNLQERSFWNKHDPGDLEWTSSNRGGGHEGGGCAPLLGAPPISWAPRCSTDVLLPPIYTYVPPNYQIRSQKPNSTAATFCTREIPSWGLFRSSAGGGVDHGGPLHQLHGPSDDV